MKIKHTVQLLLITLTGLIQPSFLKAQDKFYTSTGLEMLFSWADIQQDGIHNPSIIRWAPVINIQTFINYDVSEKFGVFSGIGIRNTGFIYDVNESTRRKARTYNMGVPLGIKIGNFDKFFFYVGYEIELPFNYREKTFISDQKTVYNEWFTSRVPTIYNSLLAGVQLPKGLTLKFKYYFTNFYNKDYVQIDQETGDPVYPYKNLDVNVFFISIGMNLFKDKNLYFED
jgi:hypothetical protein